MRAIADYVRLLVICVVAAVRTWWVFRGERGVEADDVEKERDIFED